MARSTTNPAGSCSDFPAVDHEGHQACTVLISKVTQRGALVVRIAIGCPYYKSPAIFHLFCKLPQTKNCLFPRNPLPLCNPLRFVQLGQESGPLSSSAKSLVQLGNTFTQSGCGCLKKCLQLSKLLPLPSHKLHTFPKIYKKTKKKQGNNFG